MKRIIETPQDMQDLMKECSQLTHHYIELCNDKFGLRMPQFKVMFGLKASVSGKAMLGRGIINYNPTLLRENPEVFLRQTVGHEVVHFACYAKYGPVDGHGPEWKSMMVMMGLEPVRCHSYDTTNVPSNVGRVKNKTQARIIQADIGQIKTFGIGKVIEFD